MREANGRRLAVALALAGAIFPTTIQAQTPGASLMPADKGASAAKHFDPLGKPASKFTLELRNGLKSQLPFADKRDFDEAKRGFIAAPPYAKIMADAGHVAWDIGSYGWLLTGKDFESSSFRGDDDVLDTIRTRRIGSWK